MTLDEVRMSFVENYRRGNLLSLMDYQEVFKTFAKTTSQELRARRLLRGCNNVRLSKFSMVPRLSLAMTRVGASGVFPQPLHEKFAPDSCFTYVTTLLRGDGGGNSSHTPTHM